MKSSKAREDEQYWRSHAGAEQYREQLDLHFSKLLDLAESTDVIPRISFDVIVLESFPEAGRFTIVTKGLSSFILPRPDADERSVRQEIAWTLDASCNRLESAEVLFSIGNWLLSRHMSLSEGELIRDIDLTAVRSDVVRTRHLLVMLDHWFDRKEARIDTYFKCYIVELLAVTDREADLIERDTDLFFARCSAGEIDPLDFSRQS